MKELEQITKIANEKYDGHFTLLKFTTNWRCCFGTPYDIMVTNRHMAEGKTMEEAINNCIENNINIADILEKVKEEEKWDSL
jgi:hypothetical protein